MFGSGRDAPRAAHNGVALPNAADTMAAWVQKFGLDGIDVDYEVYQDLPLLFAHYSVVQLY